MANYFVRFDPVSNRPVRRGRDRPGVGSNQWRLLRIPQLEEDLWALGTVLFAGQFEDQPEEARPGLIRAHTFLNYGKRFDNLSCRSLA